MTDLDPGADLREHLDRAMSDLSAPTGLTETALTDGRRLRRRRRSLTAASGLAAAAVVALVITNLGGGSAGTAESDIATQPPASPSADKPDLTPDGGSPFPDPPQGWWDMPSEEMAAHLEELLPEGVAVTDVDTVMEDVAPGEDPITTGTVRASLEIDAGRGAFEILMYSPELDEVPDPVSTTDANGDEHTTVYAEAPSHESRVSCPANGGRFDACAEITGGGGAVVGRTTASSPGEITILEATLFGPDGGLLYIATTNSLDDKWGRESTPSAAEPPLSIDQLRALVLDPGWTSYSP